MKPRSNPASMDRTPICKDTITDATRTRKKVIYENFFSLLLALMFSCTFTVCAFAAEPYAENSNPPTLQDTLQEILDNPTYSNAYKEAAKKKCDYLMSVRDSGPSALTRASNSMTIYVPHTRQPNGVSCGPSTVRQTLAHYGLVKNLSTIMSEMSDASKPATYCYSPTNGVFEISKMFYYINTSLYGEGGDPTGVVYMALWKNGAYTSSQQMLNMMASVISNNNPPILHTGAIQGTKRTSYNDTSKWPINISSGHFMSVSGYNLSNATIQVTDPDVTNELIRLYAKQLKIPSFAEYQEVLRQADPSAGFSDLLLELMKAETASRQENQNRRRLKAAGFPYLKTMEEFDYSQLNDAVSPLFLQELASCQFIQNRQNVIMIGNPGRGKTHLAIALGLKACTQGYNVLFKNAATLSTELCEAKDNYHLGKLERTLAKADLLILDELSYLSFNRHQSELLFKVISDRSEKSSTIVTTNLPFSKWTDLFENTTMVTALIDRLTFRSHVLDMNGDSYRLKATMQNKA